jgi:hypothetical protein
MSRSRRKNKWMKKWVKDLYRYGGRNSHHFDEMPKNSPSRLITTHFSADVSWLQEPTSFGGYRTRKGGHRMVSGIVRASLKEELRRDMQDGNV